MTDVTNLGGYEDGRYFGRAWALLTQQKGWWKPVLICAVAMLVPIVGPLAVFGYGLEWARRIAWGSTEAPSRKVKVGNLIQSGWRGFVAALGWGIAAVVVARALDSVPAVGGLLSFAWDVFGIFLEMLILVASVRATIYQNFAAGYRAKTLWQMGARDPWGLVRIWLIRLVAIVAVVLVSLFILIPALFAIAPRLYDLADYAYTMSYYATKSQAVDLALEIVLYVLGSLASAFVAIAAVALVTASFMNLVVSCCIGLWLRQFNVPAWGRDEDPLPEGVVGRVSEKPEEPRAYESYCEAAPAESRHACDEPAEDAATGEDLASDQLNAEESAVEVASAEPAEAVSSDVLGAGPSDEPQAEENAPSE